MRCVIYPAPPGVKRGFGADPTRRYSLVRANLMLYPTSTTVHDPGRSHGPGRHPGELPTGQGRTRRQVPTRGGKPVPGRVSRERDNPAWAATVSGRRGGSSRTPHRSSGPALPVLYRQNLACSISCGLNPARNNYSYIHKYINILFVCCRAPGVIYSSSLAPGNAPLASRANIRVFLGSRTPSFLIPVCTSTP